MAFPTPSLILFAGGAFLAGWGLARWTAPPDSAANPADPAVHQALSQPSSPGPSISEQGHPSASASAPQGLQWNPTGLEKIIASDPAVQASLKSADYRKWMNDNSGG